MSRLNEISINIDKEINMIYESYKDYLNNINNLKGTYKAKDVLKLMAENKKRILTHIEMIDENKAKELRGD